MNPPPKVGRFQWERVVRHLTMQPTTKLVVLIAATFADRDGTNIRPGNATLTDLTGLSDSTVRRAMTEARTVGVLYRESKGSNSGRAALADVYRLSLPPEHRSPMTGDRRRS